MDSILDVLDIQAEQCDINHVVFPSAWPGGFAGRIWIDEIPNHWVPWDADLEADKQYRLFVADANIFDRVYALSIATNSFVSLGRYRSASQSTRRDHGGRTPTAYD